MLFSLSRTRPLAVLAGAAVCAGIVSAAVVSRDLNKQLELIRADQGGIVVFGTIEASRVVPLEDLCPVPFTVLTVKVDQAVAPKTAQDDLTVYVPGAGEERLSVSPPESEIRVGEKVLLFLRADAGLRKVDAKAFKVDSFAEVYRTQKNRKGETIVLGEGPGSAIESNVRLSDLSPNVLTAYEAVAAAKK